MTHFHSVLKKQKVKERHVACWGCPHATRIKTSFGERISHCRMLLTVAGLARPTRASRKSLKRKLAFRAARDKVAYLPTIVEQPQAACPLDLHTDATPDDFRKPGDVEPYRQTVFGELWAEIHDPRRHWTPEWWATVVERLPCGDCKLHTHEYVGGHPIPFGDDAACAEWGITFHDAVNARLGKPLFAPPRQPAD